jgi:hypothetical protein
MIFLDTLIEGPFSPGNGPSAVAGTQVRSPALASLSRRRWSVVDGGQLAGHGPADAVLVTGAVGRQTAAMSKRPRVDQDLLHRQAQVAFLAGLLRGDDIDTLVASVAPCDVPGWFTPDVAILELAVTALDLASAPGSAPLEYEGLREHYLPEVEFRGRIQHRSSQYALYAAACMRGGLQPDLLNDAGWWQTRLWIYAVYAAVIYSRAAAERRSTTVEQVARDLAARHGLVEDVDVLVRSEDSIRK